MKKVEDKWGEKARVRGTVANRMNRANRANAAKPRWRTDVRRMRKRAGGKDTELRLSSVWAGRRSGGSR